jgi:predicted amidohydrolase YtcJ
MNFPNRLCLVLIIGLASLQLPYCVQLCNAQPEYNFIVYGDTRADVDGIGDSPIHDDVINAFLMHDPEFVIHTGDMVVQGGVASHWPYFEDSITPVKTLGIQIYGAVGNHEKYTEEYHVYEEDFATYKAHFDYSSVIDEPGENELYYSFDYGGIHFVFLNTEDYFDDVIGGSQTFTFSTEQRSWLTTDLQDYTLNDFIIVTFHRPPYSVRADRPDRWAEAETIRAELHDLFIDEGVDLVFTGHDHLYYHTLRDGIQYVTTGGGGAELAEIDSNPPIWQDGDVAVSTYHYCNVEVDAENVNVTAFTPEGTILDSFTVPRTPTRLYHPLPEPYVTTFFYPWYGENMHWGDFETNPPDSWSSNYLPDTEPDVFDPGSELYDSKDVSTINWQLGLMKTAGIRVSVSSWWGVDDYTDEAFDIIMNEVMPSPGCPYRDLKWCIYYEPEGYGDPSIDEICDDVTYIAENYGESPHYFKIDGKIVVFVWADGMDGVDYAEKWNEVRNRLGNVYTVLKVFGGYTDYSHCSDGWHQYAPAMRYEEQGSYSAFVSPGFWFVDESPRLGRSVSEFEQALGTMSTSDCAFFMVQTWNEWHEGTQVEPGQPIDPTSLPFQPSDESYGTDYVDAIGRYMQPFMPEPVQIEYINPAEGSVISGSTVTLEFRVLDAYTGILQSYISVDGEPPQEMTFTGVDAEGYRHFELSKTITEGEHEVIVFTQDEYDYFSDNQLLTFTSYSVDEQIYHNGVVYTMDDELPQAEAVFVRDGVIVDVGSDEEILEYSGADTEVIDLDGRALLPGFIDVHDHRLNDLVEVDSMEEAVEMAIRNGYTTITQLFTYPELIDEILALDQEGKIRLRVNLYLRLSWQHERWTDWYTDYAPGEMLSPMVRVLGVKMFADGGVSGGTAAMRDPYVNDPSNYGTLYFTQDELNQLVSEAHAAGYQIAIHAMGDAAVDQVLTAYETALGDETNEDYRHRIEHLYFISDDLIERMAAKGIVASFQNNWASSDFVQDNIDLIGAERAEWNGRWRDLLDSGTPCAASSDYPYCWFGSPSISGLYTSVTRMGLRWGTPVPEWMAAQRLSVEEAIRLMTIDAAYATFQEDVTGSITPGKYADLVVLTEDPFEVQPMDLMRTKIWMTVIGGKIEYWRERDETYSLNIAVDGPGSTTPPPGNYDYEGGFTVDVSAIRWESEETLGEFSHWTLDGARVPDGETITVAMDDDHRLRAVFVDAFETPTTVEIDAMTADQDPLEIRVRVDGTTYYTPVSLELEQGIHRIVPQRFKFHAIRIYVFDHWLDETGSIVSDKDVLTQQFNEDASLIAVYATLFQRLRNILSSILY